MVQAPPAPESRRLSPRVRAANPSPDPSHAECYLILGRHGDITNILPVLRDQAIRLARPLPVVVSAECAPLFDGTSYIDPVPLDLPCDQLSRAEEWARKRYQVVRTVQVWGDGQSRVQALPHYNENAWLMAGRANDFKSPGLRPVFDCRSPKRESKYLERLASGDKPILLLAARGGYSSPFRDYHAISNSIQSSLGNIFQIVDLDLLKYHRIFDLVGIMEAASVLVSADSVHLHLAAACQVPVVAMLSNRNHWAETSTRCRTVWKGNYLAALRSIGAIIETIRRHTNRPETTAPRLIHVTDGYYQGNIWEPRHSKAFVSWLQAGWLEAHLRDPAPRNGQSVGARKLSFLKDVLNKGLENARDNDTIVWTNSDTIVSQGIAGAISKAVENAPVVTGRRVDLATGKPAPGRDLAAFSAAWLRENWNNIPDFLCGAAELDNWMALAARLESGQISTAKELLVDWSPADLPTGWIKHLSHGTPEWDRPGCRYSDPGNLYNLRLFRDWCHSSKLPVSFDAHGQVNWSI